MTLHLSPPAHFLIDTPNGVSPVLLGQCTYPAPQPVLGSLTLGLDRDI